MVMADRPNETTIERSAWAGARSSRRLPEGLSPAEPEHVGSAGRSGLVGSSGAVGPVGDPVQDLVAEVEIPVLDGLQAQGDVVVIPLGLIPDRAGLLPEPTDEVPSSGVELLRAQHSHVLVADAGTCWYQLMARSQLDLAVVRTAAPVHLLHPEHGALGIAPGQYLIRRQREHSPNLRPDDRVRRRFVVD
jgi:hypothetical protein